MIPIDLSGNVALVTGATGELGRAMVRTLARAGADVVVHYFRNADQADARVKELRALGRAAVAVRADITDEGSVNALRASIEKKLRSPDIVVAKRFTGVTSRDDLKAAPDEALA
ncbi:MAG: SDR family NAD(P)-dependent oxidoreductase [Phycisphaerae bacterium]